MRLLQLIHHYDISTQNGRMAQCHNVTLLTLGFCDALSPPAAHTSRPPIGQRLPPLVLCARCGSLRFASFIVVCMATPVSHPSSKPSPNVMRSISTAYLSIERPITTARYPEVTEWATTRQWNWPRGYCRSRARHSSERFATDVVLYFRSAHRLLLINNNCFYIQESRASGPFNAHVRRRRSFLILSDHYCD